ncbi:MAG: hypothetical protein PF569_08455 [Candidatus Woesearchaeota archaeon]|nr:hypothetical protein [Candidatus Woesearchaeota archaeon]
MQTLDKDNIVLFKNDFSKLYPVGLLKGGILHSDKTIKVTKQDENPTIIDLYTDTGIANFKVIMEELLLPILKNSSRSSLGSFLKTSTVKNYLGQFTSQIIPTFKISDLNSPQNLDRFEELLNSFNDVDKVIEPKNRIFNSEGVEVSWKNLMYLYNLIVNNDLYGPKRLTPIFENFIREEGLFKDYIEFSKRVDAGEVDIFDNVSERDILWSIFNRKGNLNLNGQTTFVINNNYPINTRLENVKQVTDMQIQQDIHNTLSLIEYKNLIINYKCF